MTSPRILHVSTVHRTQDNRIYNKEVRALLEAGLDCRLLIRADAPATEPVVVYPLTAPRTRWHRLTVMQWQTWRKLSWLRPDLVHIHDPELIPLAWLWARTHDARVIYDAHESLVDQVKNKQYLNAWQTRLAQAVARVLMWWADRGMDTVVAATQEIADQFRHATVVHNYPWVADYGVRPAPVPGRLVYVGDLSEDRKFDFMVDVAHRLRERNPDAHLVLAGPIKTRNADEFRARIDGDVVRHLGVLPPREVPEVIATAQAGLVLLEPLPNFVTSLPTKLFEYQAAAVPFVASNFPHWEQLFGAGSGIFVDSEDLDQTVAGIEELLADPKRCARMGEQGRAEIEQRHAFELEAPRLVALIRGLLEV